MNIIGVEGLKKAKKKSDSRRVEWETSKYVKNL